MQLRRATTRSLAAALLGIAVLGVASPAADAGTATIESVRLIDYKIDRTKAFVTSKGSSTTVYGIFVVITAKTDDGRSIEAIGDALPRGLVTNESLADAWTGAEAMAKQLKGKSFGAVDAQGDRATLADLTTQLRKIAAEQKLTTRKPPAADKQLRATLCGFEIALLDLVAQKHKVPMYQVLAGKAARDMVTLSALTSSADASAEDLADEVDDASGVSAMRVKIGLDEKEDLARLSAVAKEMKSAGKPMDIWVDVNQAWKTAETSIAMLEKIRSTLAAAEFKGRFICEQPTDEHDLPALAAVTKQTRAWNAEADKNGGGVHVVTMADEATWTLDDVKKMVALDAADYLNIKIQKCGGPIEAMQIAAYLGEHAPKVGIYVGGVVSTDVMAWANLQLAFALPRLDFVTAVVPRRNYPINAASVPLRYSSGKSFKLPTAAGLGTGLSLKALQPYIKRDATH